MEYKIEVLMTPHYHDSPKTPYFWMIGSCADNDWCTHTAGWAADMVASSPMAKSHGGVVVHRKGQAH